MTSPEIEGGALLSGSGVGVCYGSRRACRAGRGKWALRGVDFSLERGECVAVIGQNGAGKSTLLQVAAGVISPQEGELRLGDGVRVGLLSLQVGFVPNLSGRVNALLSGMLLGISRGELIRSLPWIAEFSGLGAALDNPVKTYSAGMRARLGFAVAFLSRPEVLLIDELIGVGDAQFRRRSFDAIRERLEAGQAAMVISHNFGVIREVSTRAIWVHDGEIRLRGSVEEVLDAYRVWLTEHP